MSRPLVVRNEAEQDLAEARDWYDRRRMGLGDELLSFVEESLVHIERSPEHRPAEYRDVRRAKVRRFPYVIYYRVKLDFVEVLAILHGGRDPKAWRQRA